MKKITHLKDFKQRLYEAETMDYMRMFRQKLYYNSAMLNQTYAN